MHLQRGRSSPTAAAAASLVEAGAVVQRAAVAGGQAVHGRVQDAQLLQVFRPLRPLDHLRDRKRTKKREEKDWVSAANSLCQRTCKFVRTLGL